MLDLLIIFLEDPTPEPTDVKAGPLGFALWIFMIIAVVIIGFSLVKQLRKAQAAKDAGVYGDEPVDRTASSTDAESDHSESDDSETR